MGINRAGHRLVLSLLTFFLLTTGMSVYGLDGREWPEGIQAIFDAEAPMLCPLPQKVTWESSFLEISKGIVLIKDFPANEKLEKSIDNWIRRMKGKGFESVSVEEKGYSDIKRQNITILLSLDNNVLFEKCQMDAPRETQKLEGYVLHITSDGIILRGGGHTGLFYGLQTLSQLINLENDKWKIQNCLIYDWPHQDFRGLHVMMPGRDDLPFYHDLIDYLAELKYNHLIVEVAGGMEYKKHPEINQGWQDFIDLVYSTPGGGHAVQESQGRPKNAIHHALGGGSFITQEEVRELVQYAKSRYINILPEVPSFSHSDYLLVNHKELAENQDDPYPDTYCPSNPATYELLFDVIDEVLDVFQPEWVHIGHDEAYTFAMCERCKGKHAPDLFAGDIIKIHDYLTARGVKVMMWAEKFLNIPGALGVRYGGIEKRWPNRVKGGEWFMPEIYPAIEQIPRDIVMVDWYHGLGPYTQHYFADKGFRVIFGNFSSNMAHWEYRSRISNVMGGFVSNWTVTKEYGFAHDTNLYSHIYSSNLLWWAGYENNRADSIEKLMQRAVRHFRGQLSHNLYPSMQQNKTKHHIVDLASYANVPPAGQLQSIHKRYDFSRLQEGMNNYDGIPVNLPSLKTDNESLVSTGPETDFQIPDIKLGFKAASLCFAHTVIDAGSRASGGLEKFITPETEILGEYKVKYNDGSIEHIPLRYQITIFDYFGPTLVRYYYPDLMVQNPLDKRFWGQYNRRSYSENLFLYEWINPYPEKEIVNLDFINSDPQKKAQIFLLGLTGIELEKWNPNRNTILKRNQFIINGVENERILKIPRVK